MPGDQFDDQAVIEKVDNSETTDATVGAPADGVHQAIASGECPVQGDGIIVAAVNEGDSDCIAVSGNNLENYNAGDNNESEVRQPPQNNGQHADQPIAEHSATPQAQLSTSSQAQDPSTRYVTSEQKLNPSTHSDNNNDTTHVTTRSIYNSATTSVLGNDSDKNDFCRGAPPTSSSRTSYEKHSETIASEENNGDTTALNKLKQWFTPSASSEPSSTTTDNNESNANDYRNFDSPNPNNDNGRNGGGDVELGHVATGSSSTKSTSERAWRKSNSSQQSPLPGTEEEERVMGECSFFYNMDNHFDDDITTKQPSHRIPATATATATEECEDGYFEQKHPHYRNRRVNPRAMAQAIKTRARRQWTERRYRRRLRQSQLDLPYHSWNGQQQSEINNLQQQSHAEEFMYELTTEHRQAFQAAHAALNGKLANEYGRNRYAIRKQFGYEYDIEYDLELAQIDHDASLSGTGGPDEIRAAKSSLAIRGGLIRLPIDNVRLVCDPQLQPGILSIETRDVGGGAVGYENYGNANRYGNIHGSGMVKTSQAVPPQLLSSSSSSKKKEEQILGNTKRLRRESSSESLTEQQWRRNELAYVLTVDEQIYQRVINEMDDSYRIPCGMYYCCHGDTDGGDHVGIGVAIAILMVIFMLLVAGMIAWPTW